MPYNQGRTLAESGAAELTTVAVGASRFKGKGRLVGWECGNEALRASPRYTTTQSDGMAGMNIL